MKHLALFALIWFLCAPAHAVEPGFRARAGVSALKLMGSLGETVAVGGADFTVAAGGYADLSYRIQESFSMGVRWTALAVGLSGTDKRFYDSASLQQVLFVSSLVFNPDEDTRPFATVGLGLSWLGWRYANPFMPYPNEPDFLISDDRRRATTFLFGGGAEVQIGESWEFIPSLHVHLHGWNDHTYRGIPHVDKDDKTVAPNTVALEITAGLARRL